MSVENPKVLEIARSVYSMESIGLLFNYSLNQLLNTKSLYQRISVSDDLLVQIFFADSPYAKDVNLASAIVRHLKSWVSKVKSDLQIGAFGYVVDQSTCYIKVPRTVKTWCNLCKSITTHNPVGSGGCYSGETNNRYTHVFHVEYECQDCKRSDVSFLVMRDGLKFQLMGRSPIEVAAVSKEVASQLNDEEVALFGDALMASKTGSELAAICLLRVALESYLRRITSNKDTEKMVSGEELYEQYKKKLPKDFSFGRVESLGKVYNDLSVVMHTAKVPDGCFQDNYNKIELFFRFLSLMPLES